MVQTHPMPNFPDQGIEGVVNTLSCLCGCLNEGHAVILGIALSKFGVHLSSGQIDFVPDHCKGGGGNEGLTTMQ